MKIKLHLVLAMALANQAFAVDLVDVYQQALEGDPVFKQAYSDYMSNAESLPQAQAALFPQLTFSAQAGRNVQDSNFTAGPSNLNYNNNSMQITASQAVFNYKAWSQVQQARASVKAAQATFNDAAQNLILRTAKSYFDALLAKDTLDFAEAKKRANKRQYDQASQRFNVGLDAITSVYEAKAAYDQSIATVITARNSQINHNENLRRLTNHVYEVLAPLRNHKIPLIKPEPNDVNEWIDTGLKHNYQLLAAKYTLEASKDNIKAQSTGNWPVLSIQSNMGQTNNSVGPNGALLPTSQKQGNIALALNFPVFQGGLVHSKTRQAQYNYQSTSEKFEQTHRGIIVNSRVAFNTINEGISKVKADQQTVISQQNSLESTEAQFEAGTRTMVDVVNAQEKLFQAQEQLATDQYDLIYSILLLKYYAGSLSVQDLESVNAWLETTRVNGLPPKRNA